MQSCIGGCQGKGNTGGEGGWKNQSSGKKFEGKCYNCKKKGHMAKDCHFPLRRSTRTRKQNSKYGNAAIAEELNEKEPETFEEAYQNLKWFKAMEEEIAMC
ncbi:hypothetical protein KY290_001854 [Solanum tuberosum]|uniref:CCHC-type domain-containing protein n=1 Tax=Solanum tuberosum TaxID=4113 RepID=A0ABQ7WND8_SOLTU|nr:hypothetical protein KY290_001854 [Solanum tuberosum]